jgi:pyruvate/2-oxoglutarate/acetoin dehydrogenase E1 component
MASAKPNGNAADDNGSSGPVTFLEAIKQAMFEEMERDPAVVVIGEDVGVYGGAFKTSEGLLERFGWERVIDTPISESAIIGAACGMSYLGLRPICEMQFIDFIACCFNQRPSSSAALPAEACTAVRFTPRIRKCISCTRPA